MHKPHNVIRSHTKTNFFICVDSVNGPLSQHNKEFTGTSPQEVFNKSLQEMYSNPYDKTKEVQIY